jgi:hypothetical protein
MLLHKDARIILDNVSCDFFGNLDPPPRLNFVSAALLLPRFFDFAFPLEVRLRYLELEIARLER